MDQPDSQTQEKYDAKSLETKHFDKFNSHGNSIESVLQKPKQANGWSSSNINSSLFGKPNLLLVTLNNWFICNINKLGFLMVSVSVHVAFKSVKIRHLNCYF